MVKLRRFYLFYAIIPLLIAAFWLSATAVFAAQTESAQFVRVPVYFITDRNLEAERKDGGAQFGPHRKYIGDCLHDPYMGLGYCVVENTSGKQLSQKLLDLGWAAASPEDKEGFDKEQLITGKSFSEIEKAFYDKLSAAAVKPDHKEIVVFAHGYKNSFESAFHTASRFSYSFECPVVLYSWPSVAKVRSYSSDENNNEWSQEHYNDMLLKLQELCTANPEIKLRLFAHSMGSRLVVRAAPFLREKPHIVEAALICPDVDAGLVKHYARRYLSANGHSNIRLYMSQRDKALAFSQIIHGGYTRLGECADSIASLARNALQLSPNSVESQGLSDKEFAEVLEKTKHRMQTIDFTALDSGMIGHKIPVDLIHSFSYTNSPGPGLELIHQESGQRSRASRMLSKVTHLQSNPLATEDTCLRVVKKDRADQEGNRAEAHKSKHSLSMQKSTN